MKALLVLVLAGLALLAFLPPAAAAPGATRPAVGAEPTELHPYAPADIAVGASNLIRAILHDATTEIGLAGENLTFSLQTTFGWLLLKTTVTDAQGTGYLDYDPVAPGNYTIQVAFAGNAAYAPSNVTVSVQAVAGSAAPPPLLPATAAIVLVIVVVVGGVWATYGFVATQVLGIRADPPEAERKDRRARSTSEVKKTMEKEDSETPKRVSGNANAGSRTVLIVAALALVLGVAGLGLSAFGALTPKAAAYTPSTIKLQVAIVPDLQGDGWDVWLPNELTVHKGDTVKITVINADEMDHGFNIPDLGIDVHIDPAATNSTGALVPNVVTIPAFTADAVGQFLIKCNVNCGPGHDNMIGTLVVLPD